MRIIRGSLLSAGLFWLSVLAFLAYSGVSTIHSEIPAAIGDLVMPLSIYVMAHVLRAVRLGVLLGAGQVRRLLGLYFFSAACSAMIPFKLGELVRINEIAWWTGSYWRSLLIIWIERVFDVAALGTMVFFILATGGQESKDIGLLLWAICGFVFVTMIFFFVVPEQLCGLNLHVIRSYKGRKAVHILRMLDSCYQLFDQVRPLLKDKIVTLSLLTIFIWGANCWRWRCCSIRISGWGLCRAWCTSSRCSLATVVAPLIFRPVSRTPKRSP